MNRDTVKAAIRPWYQYAARRDGPQTHFLVEAMQPLADTRAPIKTVVVDQPRQVADQVRAYQQYFGMPAGSVVEIDIDERFFSLRPREQLRMSILLEALQDANRSIRTQTLRQSG